MSRSIVTAVLLFFGTCSSGAAQEKTDFPPGWLPLNRLDDQVAWNDFRKTDDKIHLYLPPGVDNLRGVFVCFVFHSADPRELARLWKFALVTVPWPFEYDLGHNDKRNGRYKLGHPECGLGYGGQVKAGTPLRFAAETTGTYAKIEFHSGNNVLAVATKAPWQSDDVKLDRGLHSLFAVGVKADGSRHASRPAFLMVE